MAPIFSARARQRVRICSTWTDSLRILQCESARNLGVGGTGRQAFTISIQKGYKNFTANLFFFIRFLSLISNAKKHCRLPFTEAPSRHIPLSLVVALVLLPVFQISHFINAPNLPRLAFSSLLFHTHQHNYTQGGINQCRGRGRGKPLPLRVED